LVSAPLSAKSTISCTGARRVFTGTGGLTDMLNGLPRYGQRGYRQFQRVRNADGTWNLKVYIDFLIVTDARRTTHR